MLAAHRDQENLVLSHQVPTKQQPKTPGARYPKTPLRFGRNDENAPTAFAGKSAIKGAANLGGNDKLIPEGTGARQVLLTPTEPQTRAVLGNKTTNAKARIGQSQGVGVKDRVREIEKSQVKQTTIQKPKQKQAELAPRRLIFDAKNIQAPDQEEPEYAPPRPEALPYQSDILPEGGLTFEGLKKENLMRGYYQHFYNPVDKNGMSRREKEFNDEMKVVMEKAMGRNDRDTEELTWNTADIPEEPVPSQKKKSSKVVATTNYVDKRSRDVHQRPPSTLSSRRAVSALAIPSGTSGIAVRPLASSVSARKPLTSLIRGHKSIKPAIRPQSACNGASPGEAASRTTIGYTKGRSASSILHHRGETIPSRPCRTTKAAPFIANDEASELTITPARLRQGVSNKELVSGDHTRPQFLSIFDKDDDGELPQINIPYQESENEEDFELKLDIQF